VVVRCECNVQTCVRNLRGTMTPTGLGSVVVPALGQEIYIIIASRFLNYSVESSTSQRYIYLNLFYPQKFRTLQDIKMATNGTNGERNKELEDIGVHLSQIKSSGAVTISPELFEKVIPNLQVFNLYLLEPHL
jgi:hypothetical protein